MEKAQSAAANSALPHPDSPELLSGPDAVMSHKGAATISRRMEPHWTRYADKLGIEKARQKEIRHDNPGLCEQRFQLLRMWIQQEGKAATWRRFISVCSELRDNSLQESAISLCKHKTVALNLFFSEWLYDKLCSSFYKTALKPENCNQELSKLASDCREVSIIIICKNNLSFHMLYIVTLCIVYTSSVTLSSTE